MAEHLSFTEAARLQNVSQSALSQQIKQLEAELGVSLFARSPQRVALTRAGELVVEHARRTLDSAARLEDEIEAFRGMKRGTLRMAVTQSFSALHLGRALSGFLRDFRQIDVSALEWSNDAIIAGVLEGSLDLGVVFGPIEAAVSSLHLYDDSLMLACPSGHELAKMRTIPVRKLEDVTLALLPPRFGTRRTVDEYLKVHRVTPSRVVELDTFQSILKLIEGGDCVSIMPGIPSPAGMDASISFRTLNPSLGARSISLIWPTAHLRSPASEAFGRILMAQFATVSG